jgi:hypothetical protein
MAMLSVILCGCFLPDMELHPSFAGAYDQRVHRELRIHKWVCTQGNTQQVFWTAATSSVRGRKSGGRQTISEGGYAPGWSHDHRCTQVSFFLLLNWLMSQQRRFVQEVGRH